MINDELCDKIIVKYALEGCSVPDKLMKQIIFMKMLEGKLLEGDPWAIGDKVDYIMQSYNTHCK